MANYSKTVTHGLRLINGKEGVKPVPDVIAGIAHDLEYVDGRVVIEVRRQGTMTNNALAGTVEESGALVDTVYAARMFPSSREIDQSNGKIRVGDRKFHYESAHASFVPAIGDHLIYGGVTYEIVAVDVMALATRYAVYCRA